MNSTTIRSRGALALGIFFTAVTARTILDDVWNGAPFTVSHLQAAAALVAAIASGHMILPTIKQGRIPAALGLALIFATSTGYIVVSAGARNAEVAGVKGQDIAARNNERRSAATVLAKAEAETRTKDASATDAIRAAALECASGEGIKCRGKKATREDAKDALTKAKEAETLVRGKMLVLGPFEQEHAGYHHVARTFEAVGFGSATKTEPMLELVMPFVLVLISEVATLVFMSMAFGHRKPSVSTVSKPTETEETGGGGKPETPRLRLVQPEDHELKALRTALVGRGAMTNDELAAAMQITKGEASKRVAKAQAMGLVSKSRVGKTVAISYAS